MQRKHIGTIVGVVALALIVGGITRGCASAPNPDTTIAATDTAPVTLPEVGEASPMVSDDPSTPAVPATPAPTSFVMPDFENQDENDVESWLDLHDISVTTTFDYGEAEGSECAEAGDGVVEAQSPKAGTKLANNTDTRLVFDAYCDY